MSAKLQAASSSVCLAWSQDPLQLLPGPLPCWVSVPPPCPLLQFLGPSGLLLFLLVPPLLPSKTICSHGCPLRQFLLLHPDCSMMLALPQPSLVSVCLLPSWPPAFPAFVFASFYLYAGRVVQGCVPLFKPPVALQHLPPGLERNYQSAQSPFKTMFIAAWLLSYV